MASAPKAVIETFYQAMSQGDGATVMGLLAPDIEWTEAEGFPYAGTYQGPQAIAENVFARLGTEWDGFAAVPELIVADGAEVVARGWYSGVYQATGKAFRARYVHWFQVADGAVQRFEQVTDTLLVSAALS